MTDPSVKVMKPSRHAVLFWALAAIFICYIDRTIISLAVIDMQDQLNWDDSAAGAILAIFYPGYMIMQLAGGVLANRFGGRNVFLAAVILWSLFTLLTPAAAKVSFGTLLFARFMVGFGEGAAFPAVYSLINQWMRKDEVTTSIGYMTAATTTGTILALGVSGMLIEMYGWPSIFYLFGSMGFVWALLWVLIVPARARYSEDRQKYSIKEKSPIPWHLLFTHKAAIAVYAIAVSGAIVSFTLVSYMPKYFADRFGASTKEAGLYAVIPFVVITFASVGAGIFADRWIKKGAPSLMVRKRMVYFGFILCAVSLALLTTSESILFSVVCLSAALSFYGIAAPSFTAVPGEMLPNHGDILYGIMAFFGSVVAFIAIGSTGLILKYTGSYDMVFIAVGIVSLLGMLVFGLLGRNDPIYE